MTYTCGILWCHPPSQALLYSQDHSLLSCRDASGTRVISSDIVIPARFRVVSRDASGDGAVGDVARVEGNDALQWLTSDMNMYVTIVKDTVAATLPKVAVMLILDRIITNDLQRRLQRMALQVCARSCNHPCHVAQPLAMLIL